VIVAADGEVEPDHVVGERHHGVERGRPGMIAHACADPADPRPLRLFDGEFRGPAHHQMAHAVVAVEERGRRPLFEHLDVGVPVDAAGLDSAHIERHAEHAVGVGAAQIGLGDQFAEH
jgi:hypothetical protein